jgi:hypothetical protein
MLLFLVKFLAIRAQCNSSTIMCVGGGAPESGTLKVVACAKCLDITTQTKPNVTRLYGLAYWYMTPQLSFGFSHSPQIAQSQADVNTIEADSRLSWHLNLSSGGWRLGNVTSLNNENKLYKKIFLKGIIRPLAPNKIVVSNVIKTKSKGVVTKPKSKVATNKPKGKLVTTKPKSKVATTKPKGKLVTTKPKSKVATTKSKGKLVTTKSKGKLVTTKPKVKLTTTLSNN